MIIIKKYSNRRLYDTSRSQYITLEELAGHIRQGEDVQVLDAKSGDDLTQPVLAQIIVESRGAAKLLPSSMLMQLIRMEDDALSDFFSYYMAWALSFYLKARQSTRQRMGALGAFAPPSPFGSSASPNEAFGQWFQAMTSWSPMNQQPQGMGWPGMPGQPQAPPMNHPEPPPEQPEPAPAQAAAPSDDVAQMRAELDEIKALLRQAVSGGKG